MSAEMFLPVVSVMLRMKDGVAAVRLFEMISCKVNARNVTV